MAKVISGKEISEQIKQKLRQEVQKLSLAPVLAIVQVGARDDSNVYIRMKKNFAESVGVQTKHIQLAKTTNEKEVFIFFLSSNGSTYGLMVSMIKAYSEIGRIESRQVCSRDHCPVAVRLAGAHRCQ